MDVNAVEEGRVLDGVRVVRRYGAEGTCMAWSLSRLWSLPVKGG